MFQGRQTSTELITKQFHIRIRALQNTNQDAGREWLGREGSRAILDQALRESLFEELRFELRPKCRGGICPEKTGKAVQSGENVCGRPEQEQAWHTGGQWAHGKILSISNYQRHANQNYVITSHQSEWPSSKSRQIINAGEGVERREPSCTVGGNVIWCSQYGGSLKH